MRLLIPFFLCIFFLSSCSPYKFFYHPNNKLYVDPAKLDYAHEMKWYTSQNGKKLFGLFFPAKVSPKGLVIHFHGNFGNVSNHFPLSYFMVDNGFDVFVFDYQGYGGSEGKPSPKKLIEDGIATIKYGSEIRRNNSPLFIFGHSLGGAVAIASLAQYAEGVQAIVIQSSFTRYRSIARNVIGRAWILWPLYPIFPFFLSKKYDPLKWVKNIHAIPILFVHGEKDQIIPVQMSKDLYEQAHEPKELYVVENAGHNNLREVGGDIYKNRIVHFFTGSRPL